MLLALWSWSRNRFATPESTYALLVYLAGLAILIYGVVQLAGTRARRRYPSGGSSPGARSGWLVAGITAIGAFMVLYLVEIAALRRVVR